MNIKFSGFNENTLTFEYTGTLSAGDLVKMSASAKVVKATANGEFIGVCTGVRNGYAAVQTAGYVEFKKSGTVNVGYNKLVAASDALKTAETGIDRLVIYVDDTTVGFIL